MEINSRVFEKAKTMSQGRFVSEAILQDMCKAACEELLQRLKDGVVFAEIEDRFILAAAMLGISLSMGLEAQTLESFSAGSVSMKRRLAADSGKAAQDLKVQAELMLAGCIDDGGFVFRTVRI